MNVLRSNWFTGLLIIVMPFALFYWMSTAMAYGQVQSEAQRYGAMSEYRTVESLQAATPGATIFLRGTLAAAEDSALSTTVEGLLIYQERPLDGREVRFGEEFPLTLPAFVLMLEDGSVAIAPTAEDERLISHELHRAVMGDRELTGFAIGDTVTVQGKWEPADRAASGLELAEVNGVFGADKAQIMTEVQSALRTVQLVKNGLGLLTLISIMLLALQVYRWRKTHGTHGDDLFGPLPHSV